MSDFLDRYVKTAGPPSPAAIRTALWNASADQARLFRCVNSVS